MQELETDFYLSFHIVKLGVLLFAIIKSGTLNVTGIKINIKNNHMKLLKNLWEKIIKKPKFCIPGQTSGREALWFLWYCVIVNIFKYYSKHYSEKKL